MYTAPKLAGKYAHYFLTASNGKGHGVHSPFVYNFIRNVLMQKTESSFALSIEALRRSLLKNETEITVDDFGAGSSVIKSHKRKVSKIAAS